MQLMGNVESFNKPTKYITYIKTHRLMRYEGQSQSGRLTRRLTEGLLLGTWGVIVGHQASI